MTEERLEDELRRWREARHQRPGRSADCRTVKVNGREVVVLTKIKRTAI